VSTPNFILSAPVIFQTIVVGAFLIGFSACQANPARIPGSVVTPISISLPTQASADIAPMEPTSQPVPSGTPAPHASITSPSPTSERLTLVDPKVVVLAENLSNPDDLTLAPDGSIYISDIGDGSIRQYLSGGSLRTIVTNLDEPEGMVLLPDGAMVIAEQGKNRLVRLDPQTRSISTFVNLKNNTTQAGVDGITLDTHDPGNFSLIIPDSPNGVILRLSLDAKTFAEIAHGFSRPTAAWIEKDGSLLIVDENAQSLSRIHPDGSIDKLAQNLPTPDDVVEDNSGHIFVNTLADGAIHVIKADGSQDSILVSNLSSPQGMIFDSDGNLVVTDSGHGRLLRIMIH
jgi:sugar lactone lactonase YvrE